MLGILKIDDPGSLILILGNRFRKLLVRYEKLERSFLALNHLAAAIIAFRRISLKINIILRISS